MLTRTMLTRTPHVLPSGVSRLQVCFFLLLVLTARAQVCTGDVMLASEADVDAFACTEGTGTLQVATSSGSTDPITDLTVLGSLTSAGGNLDISSNATPVPGAMD